MVWLLSDLEDGLLANFIWKSYKIGHGNRYYVRKIKLMCKMMPDAHGYRYEGRSLNPLTPLLGWKCPKSFKLGLGKPWESDSDIDDFMLVKTIA